MLLLLKSLREIKSQGQKITAITDYGADVCLAEYASPEETEKALLELTKDIYQKRRIIFMMPKGGWNAQG